MKATKISVIAWIDGKAHQVLLTEREQGFVLDLLGQLHLGAVKVSDEPLEALELVNP